MIELDMTESKWCPDCKGTCTVPTQFAVPSYRCQTCGGTGVLFRCLECGAWIAHRDMEAHMEEVHDHDETH